MLTISGLRNFYFLPNMTDMRCGYNRIMEIVRTVYGRDPYDGDVYFYVKEPADQQIKCLKICICAKIFVPLQSKIKAWN